LIISKTTSIDQSNFGNFGGGGKSGKFTVGKVGISGNSGISILGNIGRLGKFKFNNISTFGTSGRYSFGKLGSNIGLVFTSNSGNSTVNQALILCKSIIKSGHLGNLIIGILGIIASISLNSKSKASCLSFLHS
jgi:hypothetical protein